MENQERKTSLKKSKNKLTFTFHNSFDRGCLTICGPGPFCVSTKTNLSSICVLHRFSRRVLWLRVAYTNNDPQVVASYFMNFVTEVGGKTIVFSNVTHFHNCDYNTERYTCMTIKSIQLHVY